MPFTRTRYAQLVAAFVAAAPLAFAQTAPLAPRDVPARSIPVPTTVSPELQQLIAAPLRPGWNTPPTTPEGWKQLAETGRVNAVANVNAMRDRLHVKVEPGLVNGVKIWEEKSFFFTAEAPELWIGHNGIGGTGCGPEFTGDVREAARVVRE